MQFLLFRIRKKKATLERISSTGKKTKKALYFAIFFYLYCMTDTHLKLEQDTIMPAQFTPVQLVKRMSSTESGPEANEAYSVHTMSSRQVPVYSNEAYGVCGATTHHEEPEYEVV